MHAISRGRWPPRPARCKRFSLLIRPQTGRRQLPWLRVSSSNGGATAGRSRAVDDWKQSLVLRLRADIGRAPVMFLNNRAGPGACSTIPRSARYLTRRCGSWAIRRWGHGPGQRWAIPQDQFTTCCRSSTQESFDIGSQPARMLESPRSVPAAAPRERRAGPNGGGAMPTGYLPAPASILVVDLGIRAATSTACAGDRRPLQRQIGGSAAATGQVSFGLVGSATAAKQNPRPGMHRPRPWALQPGRKRRAALRLEQPGARHRRQPSFSEDASPGSALRAV